MKRKILLAIFIVIISCGAFAGQYIDFFKDKGKVNEYYINIKDQGYNADAYFSVGSMSEMDIKSYGEKVIVSSDDDGIKLYLMDSKNKSRGKIVTAVQLYSAADKKYFTIILYGETKEDNAKNYGIIADMLDNYKKK